jgi:uncharacterized membrane protein
MSEETAQLNSINKVTIMVYILQAIALFTVLPMIIAVIVNYVKLDEARGTRFESHFRWQIRTFWFGLLFYVIAAILHVVLIGFVIGAITWLWQVYRVIKGCWRLSEHKPMYK